MTDRTDIARCPGCGTALTREAGGDWCPRCALAAAFTAPAVPPAGDAAGTPGDALFCVPGHAVLAELGRGAAGIVYRARQEQPAREVALKILRPHELGSVESLARFRLEAATVAALDHPVILPVLTVGEHDGLPYFTMKLCRDALAGRLKKYRGQWREAAELLAVLAEAVHYAHLRGVLHRDLKPGNVLFDEADRPFISDFGLAKLIETPAAGGPATRPLLVMGTPGYLAPEVLAGGAGQATTAADVFALGAILHELLAGAPPPASAAAATPRPGVPRDLAVICAHALAAEPGKRYASAEALATDLRAWLSGRPIAARPVSALGRSWAWARRNPALAVLALALALTMAGATVVLAMKNRALRTALAATLVAEARSQASLAESLMAQARAARQSGREGQRFETLRLIQQSARLGGPSDSAATEALAALALEDWRWIKRLPLLSHLRARVKVDFTPDLSTSVVSSADGTAPEVHRVDNWAVVRRCAPASVAPIEKVGFGPRADWIWAYYEDETQAVWGPDDVQPRWACSSSSQTAAPAMAGNGSGWWFTGPGHRVGWHDAATGAERWLGDTGSAVYGLTPSPDDRRLAVVRDDRLEVWDVNEEKMLWAWAGDVGFAPAAWSLDGRWLVSDRFVGSSEIVIWDARNGVETQTFRQGQMRSSAIALHPDGWRLLSLDSDDVLRVWHRWTGRELVRGQAGSHVLRLSSDGRRAAVGAGYQQLGLIEFGPDEIVRHFPLTEVSRSIWQTVAVSSDDRWLLGGTRVSIHLWSVATGREELRWNFRHNEEASAWFAPAGGQVVRSGTETGVQTRAFRASGQQPSQWGEIREVAPANREVVRSISPDGGRWWVENYAREKTQVWPEGDPTRAADVAIGGLQSITEASADGRWMSVIENKSKDAKVLELPTRRIVATLPTRRPSLGVFSADGHWFILGSDLGYDIWRTGEWSRPAAVLPIEQSGAIYGYALFSPDSRRLAITTGLSTIGVSRAGIWHPDFVFTLPGGAQRDAWAWSHDGNTLFVLSGQQVVTAWSIPAAEAALRRLKAGAASDRPE